MDTFRKLRALIGKEEKKKFFGLFILMIIAALIETLGIGLIAPFVSIVTNPDIIFQNDVLFSIYSFFGFNSTNSFLIFAIIVRSLHTKESIPLFI